MIQERSDSYYMFLNVLANRSIYEPYMEDFQIRQGEKIFKEL